MTVSLLSELNRNAAAIAEAAAADPSLGIETVSGFSNARVLNFAGSESDEASDSNAIVRGLKLAEISMGGLGQVNLADGVCPELGLQCIEVVTDHPLLACMASQYAGWPLKLGDSFYGMCSGPARCLRGRESLLEQYGLVSTAGDDDIATGVLEAGELPPLQVVEEFASQCSVDVSNVVLCVANTSSIAGTIGVVARSLETALHKLHELSFDLTTIKRGSGTAPMPPVATDDTKALGWTNDAILYGARVNLEVDTDDEAIESVIDSLPSQSSSDFGSPFLEIFERYDHDFYKVDPLLFAPAHVEIYNRRTKRKFSAGKIRNDILRESFLLPKKSADETE